MIGHNDLVNIFQALPGNYIILLPDAPKFTIVTYNERRADETFTRPEHIGKGIFEAFPDNPEDPEADGVAKLTASLETVLRTKAAHQMAVQKYDIPGPDGKGFELRYWKPWNTPVLNANGEVAYIIHAVEDVTALITAEHREAAAIENFGRFFNEAHNSSALSARDRINRLNQHAFDLFMQAPFGICILTGTEHNIVLANRPILEIWGKDASVIGKRLLEGLSEIEGQGFVELLDEVKRTGKTITANERRMMLVREGMTEEVYINFVYQPYYDENEVAYGILVAAIEVTEEVLSRKQIEYAEETARLALESGNLGSYEINLVTDEMITTPRFNAIWGLDHSVPRSAYASVIHDEDKPVRLEAHAESLKTGKLQYEARVVWSDGSHHWVRVNGTLLYDADRKPMRLLGVIQDITEQRAFEEEMGRLVRERTAELEKANAELEKTNAELEQFASITSHDLQEPLRKIQVYNSLLIGGSTLEEEARRYAEKIGAAAGRMGGLINDLLEYSRLSQQGDHFSEVDLTSAVRLVLADFELMVSQKNAIVRIDKLDTIRAIPLQINQLFFNLIGNALKFSKPNVAPVITISGSRLSREAQARQYSDLDNEKDYYRIVVTDNGIGFDQGYAEKIFQVFQRLHNKQEYSGYGIGLALCSKVVANHGGLIWAEGKVGEGAAFIVVLPVG